MRSTSILSLGCLASILLASGCGNQNSALPTNPAMARADDASGAQWAIMLDNIEACSCPTFCQCYFTGQPALHEGQDHAMRYCRFNNAYRVAKGHYGATNLDGMKFWMAGDLGGDFSKGQMDWAVLHFEPSATPEQRKAAEAIVHAIFPVKWNSFTTGGDGKIDWQKNDDAAMAKLDDGKTAEVSLKQVRGDDGKAVVIQNVKFWAAPKNSGFAVMKNDVEAYRAGDKPFEYKQTNGFFTTIQMTSADVHAAGQAAVPSRVQLLKVGTMRESCCSEMARPAPK